MEHEDLNAAELIIKVQNSDKIKELEWQLEEHLAENETLKQDKEATSTEHDEFKESEAREKGETALRLKALEEEIETLKHEQGTTAAE